MASRVGPEPGGPRQGQGKGRERGWGSQLRLSIRASVKFAILLSSSCITRHKSTVWAQSVGPLTLLRRHCCFKLSRGCLICSRFGQIWLRPRYSEVQCPDKQTGPEAWANRAGGLGLRRMGGGRRWGLMVDGLVGLGCLAMVGRGEQSCFRLGITWAVLPTWHTV